jgi:H+-transporting ATPase
MSKHEIENHNYGAHSHGGASDKIEGKGGDMEVEEQIHHEHVEEISPELERLLKTDPLKGLSDDEVLRRRETFGRNELVEKKRHPILKFLGYFTGAIAYLIEIAVICSAIVGVSVNRPCLYQASSSCREDGTRTD